MNHLRPKVKAVLEFFASYQTRNHSFRFCKTQKRKIHSDFSSLKSKCCLSNLQKIPSDFSVLEVIKRVKKQFPTSILFSLEVFFLINVVDNFSCLDISVTYLQTMSRRLILKLVSEEKKMMKRILFVGTKRKKMVELKREPRKERSL